MKNEIDLSKSVHDLCEEHDELAQQLQEIGFDQISSSMLATAGRFISLTKGAQMKKIPLETLIERLEGYGYTITNK